MAGLDSFGLKVDGLTLHEESANHRQWVDAEGVAYRLAWRPASPSWTFDLTHPQSAVAFYADQCERNGGVMLSCRVTQVAGVEALAGVFKYRAPFEGSMGMYFVGILWVPFEGCVYQLNVEALERGTTGVREAAVMVLEPPAPVVGPEPPPEIVASVDELFARMRARTLVRVAADDEKWDASFPQHPLSQVRARLARLGEEVALGADVRVLAPFRLPASLPRTA